MPFILEEIRKILKDLGISKADAVGDLCYIVYVEMMRRWNASPRWTTIHYMKREFVKYPDKSEFLLNVKTEVKHDWEDVTTAAELAFDVFFHFHGIKYEEKKRAENGDIL